MGLTRVRRHLRRVLTQAPQVGLPVDLELRSRIAPVIDGIMPTYTVTNPSVLTLSNPPPYIYDQVRLIQATATAAGETEVVVQFRDQELRVPIVVAP